MQMMTHIPTITCSVTSALEPAQLMAESVICRGMLYSPSRTTVVVLVEMKWSVVLVSILYSSTISPDTVFQLELTRKYCIPWSATTTVTLAGGDGGPIFVNG